MTESVRSLVAAVNAEVYAVPDDCLSTPRSISAGIHRTTLPWQA